jgi:hypothetical protein
MPDPQERIRELEFEGHQRVQAEALKKTSAREQANLPDQRPVAKRVSKDADRPEITLRSGDPVDARAAVSLVERLRALLEVDPDEFQSLRALAEGRTADANPQHFPLLKSHVFLERDGCTIRPIVRAIILNCYEITLEGPVIVPLRVKDESSIEVTNQAQEQLDEQRRRDLFGDDGQGTGLSRK